MKLVCLGDSLTYGYGVPRKDCWVSLAAASTGHTLVNRGISGDTTGGMLARFDRDVLREKPDRVLLMGGANDIIFGGSDTPARRNLAAMVHQAVYAGIRPMIGLPPPVYAADIPEDWLAFVDYGALLPVFAAYRDWLVRFARTYEVRAVDFAVPGLLPRRGTPTTRMGSTPTGRGTALWPKP